MSPQQKNLIQSAAESMRRDHPKRFGVLSAIMRARNLSEARQACNYPSPEGFMIDYHKALEHLAKELQDQGYVPPAETDSLEDRLGEMSADSPLSHFKLPSREIINRCYKGHIFHEACILVAKQNHLGLSKLWAHFTNRRSEIEIAIALTPVQPLQPQILRLPCTPFKRTQQRFLPALAGAFAMGIILLLALSPPPQGRAFKAIVTNFEEMLVSAQGIFDMNKNTPEEASATKSEPEPPRVQAAPKPVPRPKIALPDKPKLALAALPDIPRQLDRPLGTSLGGLKTPPRVSAPNLDRSTNPSSFFGSRPEVHVARATMTMPAHSPATLPSTGRDQPKQQTESDNLKGYRPAGRIGFSSFHTSAGLSTELVRLTRIQRALSRLKTPENRIYEDVQLTLAPDKAKVQFADGVAFILTFRMGQLDDIQIFARSGIDRALHIETEARRGIHFLDRALSNP